MSTNNKFTALREKLKRQKEKQKQKVFTIPKIKLTSQDKRRKAQKSFIPTTQTIQKKSEQEDKMREF